MTMNSLISMRRAVTIIIISLILLLPLNLLSFSSEADVITEVEVVTPQNCEVDVSPGSSANGTIKGSVSCTNIDPSTPLVVELTANCPIGNISINKTQIIFLGSNYEEEIEIHVQLPSLTSAHEVHGCTVNGYWEQGTTNGTVFPGEFLVVPLIFYRFSLFCNDSITEVTLGESAYFNMTINNTGNFVDDYIVNVTNREELESSNLIIPILPRFTIEAGGERTLMLIARTSDDTPEGDYQIHVNVTSVGSESDENEVIFEEYIFTLTVKDESEVNDVNGDEDMELPIVLLILLCVIIISVIAVVILRERTRKKGDYQ
jgi:hypothetical protein